MMRHIPIIALASVADAIISKSVVATNPYDCDVFTGVRIGFSEDHQRVTASFPTAQLYVNPPAHGNPGGNSALGCGAVVEYGEWSDSNVRFAVRDVTWRIDGLNLTGDNLLDGLSAKVDFIVENVDDRPWVNPVVKYITTATMLDVTANPGLKNHQGPYEFTAHNHKLVWSNCLNYWVSNHTKMQFEVAGHTIAGGTSKPFVCAGTAGWAMDLDLVWESCYPPNDTAWGRTVVTETCNYQERNVTHARRSKKLYPMLD